MSLRILGIDVGKTCTGICFLDEQGFTTSSFGWVGWDSYLKTIKNTVRFYKPDLVVYSETVGRMNGVSVTKGLHFCMACVELATEQCGGQAMAITDGQAKKLIVGKGNAKKEEVKAAMEKYLTCKTQDEYDSAMFCLYAQRVVKEDGM